MLFRESILNDAVSIVTNRVFNELAVAPTGESTALVMLKAMGHILLNGVLISSVENNELSII